MSASVRPTHRQLSVNDRRDITKTWDSRPGGISDEPWFGKKVLRPRFLLYSPDVFQIPDALSGSHHRRS